MKSFSKGLVEVMEVEKALYSTTASLGELSQTFRIQMNKIQLAHYAL